jgi:phosphoadenosine phosphosulfate reductase
MRITKKMTKIFSKAEGYDIVLACCSGGKDSTVTSYLSSLYLPVEKLYILHHSHPWNFPDTTEQVKNMCESLGLNLIITVPDEDVEECLVKYNPPNIRNRWCTRITKVEPSRKAIKEFKGSRILFVDGSRAEESRSRRNLASFMIGKFVDRHDVLHPIYDWTEKRVWRTIRAEGLPIHPVYHWSNRLSCFCCPLQSSGSWRCLRKYYPDLWEKSLRLEEKAGSPWLPGYQWLRDLEYQPHQKGYEKPSVIVRRYRGKGKTLEVR